MGELSKKLVWGKVIEVEDKGAEKKGVREEHFDLTDFEKEYLDKIKALIKKNPALSFRQISMKIDTNYTSVERIIKKLTETGEVRSFDANDLRIVVAPQGTKFVFPTNFFGENEPPETIRKKAIAAIRTKRKERQENNH